MIELAKYAFILLLFIINLYMFYHVLSALLTVRSRRNRLMYRKNFSYSQRMTARLLQYGGVYRHVSDMLEAVRWRVHPSSFFVLSFVLFLFGVTIGALVFDGLKGMAILSFILALLPYLLLKMKLVSLQIKTRMEFLPAVEIFYQRYVMSGHKNLRVVLQDILREDRLVYPMKPVFDQLNRHLSTNRDVQDAMHLFVMSLGHEWARYFANIYIVGLREGVDIQESLQELITDMRNAQRLDQAERNRLLEIRVANFSPLLFLVVFLLINYKLDPNQTIQYYVMVPEGRSLILESLLLIFLSFLMGVYLSLKRM